MREAFVINAGGPLHSFHFGRILDLVVIHEILSPEDISLR
jgi:hypothetical protein